MAGRSPALLKTSAFDLPSALPIETGRPPVAPRPKKHLMPSLHIAVRRRGGDVPHTHTPKARRPHNAFEANCTPSPRRAARAAPTNPPRPRAPAGASWVLRSLIREASLGIGLGVVFGSVWSVMQTGPVSRRISEYYKNNPTQS